ncbi:MAG TPA: HAD-IA family hydrolase [Desulfuromonadales bacterium]|nr:HAD-IA family hydrolase [Desulfuromonadales bacterium]
MCFDTFLFDLDGTLVDSVADLATAVNLLRAELSLPPLDIPTVRGYVGDGATFLVKRSLPEGLFSEERLQRFLVHYGEHLLESTVLYPGIRTFLDERKNSGLKMAVVTNKPHRLTRLLLEGLALSGYFPVVIGGDSLPQKKPDPRPVWRALEELAAAPQSTILIGDHHTDLAAGRAAGIRTCFCAWGIGEDGGLPHDFRAATPYDLPTLFPVQAA